MTTAATTTEFAGFTDRTQTFLAGLAKHNDKAWFDQNRAVYDEHLMAPARAFVEAAGEALRELSPGVVAEPKVNGSIFRINRDTRFSNDKRPYKDHLDFWFWDGTDRKRAVTGWFFRITADAVGVGVGAHGFEPSQLSRYRDLVVDPKAGPALRSAVTSVEKAGFDVHGEHYKRLPKGFDEPDDELTARLLRHNALWTGDDFETPASLTSKRLVGWCMTRWRKQTQLHEWLRDHLQD